MADSPGLKTGASPGALALDLEDGGDANFGAGLVLWDRLFGSFHHPVDRQGPPVQGIAEGPPRSLASTLLRP